MTPPRDELLDDAGRLRGPWRRMLGTLLGLGTTVLRERAAELERAFEEEGAAAMLAGAPSAAAAQWRCDPIPFLFTEGEFSELVAGLAQRASLLELILGDVYGPRRLLAEGLLPPALVYPGPRYLRPCRPAAIGRHVHLYAADLMRGPDGRWCVLADRTAEPAGLAYVLENRRMMAAVLPELFRSVEVAPIRPFFDMWQDVLQRLAPPGTGSPGLALLTPGHADARWFEHVVMARELGCTLVEAGDLTVRDGALWIKTLLGLQPVQVLLRWQSGAQMDSLELVDDAASVPGLFTTLRSGAVHMQNSPGAAFAEAPGLMGFLPVLARRLLGEDLRLPGVEVVWLGDPDARALVEAQPSRWIVRSALDGAAPAETGSVPDLLARIAEQPWAFAAMAPPRPSVAPCAGAGETLEPHGVVIRLFLLFDGVQWRPLQGGVARVLADREIVEARLPRQALSKDVWVLVEEGGDIVGPRQLAVPNLAIRRSVGDLPSRVADNFYWFGRYLERLENAARLTRAMLARLSRPALLPRERPELAALAACLIEAGVVGEDWAAASGPGLLAEMLLHALARDTGALAGLTGQVQSLADLLRDRLSGEMHAMIAHGARGLKGARLALGGGRQGARRPAHIGLLNDFAGRVLEFCAAVSGYAAENMGHGGGWLFLDLGRRIERGGAIAVQLSYALDHPPERVEAGLRLALELCDSTLTYRSRYLTLLQPATVLDLVLADEGNPRALGYQWQRARQNLAMLAGQAALGEVGDDARLTVAMDALIDETHNIVAGLVAADDQAAVAAALPARLRAIAVRAAGVSDAVRRQYFTLLPVTWTDNFH